MQQEYKDKLREVVKSMAEQGYEQGEIERIIKRYNKRYNEYDLPGQVKPQKQKPVSTDTTTADPGKEDAQQQTSGDAAAGQDNTASTSGDGSADSLKSKDSEGYEAEELYDMEEDDVVSYFGSLNVPGLEIEKASVVGNQYNVKIAGQEPFKISASYVFGIPGDKEEAVSGFQKILDYQKSVKEKDASYIQDFSLRIFKQYLRKVWLQDRTDRRS